MYSEWKKEVRMDSNLDFEMSSVLGLLNLDDKSTNVKEDWMESKMD
jgi:hypothetical protein